MPAGKKAKTPHLTPEEAKAMSDVVDKAIRDFHGTVDELQGAIGMFMIGRHIGWRPLVVMYSGRTIRKYEEILKIQIREAFPEQGPDFDRSIGYAVAMKLSNFWKGVSGAEKVDGRRVLE